LLHWPKREEPLWASLRTIKDIVRIGGILDIGANVGDWSRKAREEFYECPIHLIEAQPSLEPDLKATAFPYTITLLGAETKPAVPFHLTGTGSSAMKELTGFHEGTIELPMQRLDDIAFDLPSPLLVKLDVQGFEIEVLRGAPETLKRTEVIVSEVSLLPYNEGAPLMHEVIAFLAERDFLPFDICGGWRRSSDKALAQTDMIFARKDSRLRAKRKFWENQRD